VKKIGVHKLHSLNPDYDDIPISENIHFKGKVVGVLNPEDIGE
jgi:SOS-response transcriptional repressor LexA